MNRLMSLVLAIAASLVLSGCSIPRLPNTDDSPSQENLANPYGQAGSLADGGTVFTFQAVDQDGSVSETVLDQCRDVLQERITIGIRDRDVRVIRRNNSIVVAFPAGADPEAVARTLQRTGLLEIIDTNGQFLQSGANVATDLDEPVAQSQTTEAAPTYHDIISSEDIADAFVTTDNFGQVAVGFELTDEGSKKLYDFTSTHIGYPMSIAVDKVVISSPQIIDVISENGQITGVSSQEAAELVLALKSGPLPTRLAIVQTSNLVVVRVDTAPLFERPIDSSATLTQLSRGTLVYFNGTSVVGDDGQAWWPVIVLETGQPGYLPDAAVTSG